MPGAEYPFQMIAGVPVIEAPAEIDVTTSAQLRATLSRWHSRGLTTVVVDLTGTAYCDLAGLRELELAHERAVAGGGGLRLVTPADGAFMRIFTVTGEDLVIPAFATVQQALAQAPGAAASARFPGLAREQAAAQASALTWSIAAMSDATARLPAMKVWDHPQALAAIGEALWWITMVDATLVRHHAGAYDTVLSESSMAERLLISQTLGGLRFARNWTGREPGLDELIEPGAGTRRVTGWTWRPVPAPEVGWLLSNPRAWELARYRAYQAQLPGRTIGETFGRAVTFLTLTSTNATSGTS